MSDSISRQAVIEVLMETIAPPSITLDTLVMRVDALPSADRPKGKWIDTEPEIPDLSVRKGNKPYVCSVCGHSAGKYKYKTYKFCPWCGAEMKGE